VRVLADGRELDAAVERRPCSRQVTSAIITAMTTDEEAAQDHLRKDHLSRDGDVLPTARLRVVLAEDDILLQAFSPS